MALEALFKKCCDDKTEYYSRPLDGTNYIVDTLYRQSLIQTRFLKKSELLLSLVGCPFIWLDALLGIRIGLWASNPNSMRNRNRSKKGSL